MITIARAETPGQIQHVRDPQAEYIAWDNQVTRSLVLNPSH